MACPREKVKSGEKTEKALKRDNERRSNLDIEIERFLGYGEDVIKLFNSDIKVSRLVLYFLFVMLKTGKVLDKKARNEMAEMLFLTLDEIKKKRNIEPALKDFFKKFTFYS